MDFDLRKPRSFRRGGRDLLAAAEAVHRRVAAAAQAKPALTVGFMPGIVVTPAVRVLAERRPDVSVRLLRTS